ncbi:membrane protein, conserved [Thermococcus sp. 4557]|uniref:hypothetical protein n=1 Tax=Thermococcus sp. (strain CGMCC 1.5172 / 4557) TaxID=1042877 RepID=UPI000219EF61|nr:hypothetical protein [Thermococcus sp. 4557]AEK73133.1 membrane protein, conserved [Thermococcus sp. 4557]
MRVFVRDYLLPWVFIIVFWLVLWFIIPPVREHLNAMNIFAIFLLLIPFLLVALHFVGKTLERYGYSREDIKRLSEIIEKTHGRLYLPKEVFNIVGDALIFWGLFAWVLLATGDPIMGLLSGVAMFAEIFAFFVLLISMFIWVIIFPHSLYRLFTGREPSRDFLIEVPIKQNLIYTAILVAVRLIALHSGYPSGDDFVGELMAFGRKTELVSLLLELSGLNFLFGITGLYGPRKSRKLTALALTVIVILQLWVAWRIVFG